MSFNTYILSMPQVHALTLNFQNPCSFAFAAIKRLFVSIASGHKSAWRFVQIPADFLR